MNRLGQNLFTLLGILEKKHNLTVLDGLHRQVLYFVMDCFAKGGAVSTTGVVEQNFTSRSSTYRKISDLRQMGFLAEQWQEGVCLILPGPKLDEFIAELGNEVGDGQK
jgi:hypothetical protein